jgi:hypothetical protein
LARQVTVPQNCAYEAIRLPGEFGYRGKVQEMTGDGGRGLVAQAFTDDDMIVLGAGSANAAQME